MIQKYSIEKKIAHTMYDAGENVLRIKKFSPHIYLIATDKSVKLLDVRAENIVQSFVELKDEVRAV